MADFTDLCGWHDDQKAVEAVMARQQFPLFGPAAVTSQAKGGGRGKRALLYKFVEKANGGKFNTRLQTIGDCVSQGSGGAVDVLRAIQVCNGKGSWVAETATEPIYAVSRVEIGKGQLGNSDGSVGAWAAEGVKKFGTLVRKKYGKYDLTKYSGALAKQWGARGAGLPDDLEPEAAQHLVETVSLVTTWEELCDAIAAGYPVTIASTQGFSNVRDSKGFLKPQGSWPHQMVVMGTDDSSPRPGACIINSWGPDWVTGPKQFEQPDGSFWCDADVIEKRILSAQDSWAYSEYKGFPPKKLNLGSAF